MSRTKMDLYLIFVLFNWFTTNKGWCLSTQRIFEIMDSKHISQITLSEYWNFDNLETKKRIPDGWENPENRNVLGVSISELYNITDESEIQTTNPFGSELVWKIPTLTEKEKLEVRWSSFSARVKRMKNNNGCMNKIDSAVTDPSLWQERSQGKLKNIWLRTGAKDPAYNLTYRELSEAYMSEKNYLRPNSLYRLNSLMKRINTDIGDRKIVSVTKRELSAYLAELAEKYAENYLKDIHSFLASMGKSVENGWLQVNPCAGIRYKVKKKAKERRVYSQEIAELLQYTLRRPEGLSVHLMLAYGTTISETLGIQYSDVDFDGRHDREAWPMPAEISMSRFSVTERTIAISSTVEYIATQTRMFIDPTMTRISLTQRNGWRSIKNLWLLHNITLKMKEKNSWSWIQSLRHTRASLWVEQDRNFSRSPNRWDGLILRCSKRLTGTRYTENQICS